MIGSSAMPSNSIYESLKRYWKRRNYQRLEGGATKSKNNFKIMRFGASNRSHKPLPELQTKSQESRRKLVVKFHDAYLEMMLGLSFKIRSLDGENMFGRKRIPKAGKVNKGSLFEENEKKLFFEIYSILLASREFAVLE
ncbi:hypothetical protein AQUCO_04100099v1 [Aquilegia coerulea]|uniref:Uncharacterized protein n=1 Tax=Aquilegia coerulea TaxID=218851 RepID=A0A2G5CQB6_AQUCA|nr:hypothetical protein AQUCO_04100099v1 [Aquilegia coerulea]